MKKAALILEGGGLRGVYTAGVLDCFMENKLRFEYVIGVSMGACLGASYVANQRGRNEKVTIELVSDKRYFSFRNMIKTGNVFGANFVYNEIPKRLIPFDYVTFLNSRTKFYMTCFDCDSGETVYIDKNEISDVNKGFRATSSLPLLSTMVEIDNKKLLDGGIIDPIPFEKAIKDGYEKVVVILTREEGYRKSKQKFMSLLKLKYPRYPKIIEAMEKRHEKYNYQLDQLKKLEQSGKAFIISPSRKPEVSRLEKDEKKLRNLFELGFNDSNNRMAELEMFLSNGGI